MTVNQILKDSRRTKATRAVSSCDCDHQEAIDNLFDILIEAKVLELSLRGKHSIQTANYQGRFNVNSIPESGPLPGPTASRGRGR